jgi:hypothetical protein
VALLGSRIRKTIFSPYMVGRVLTRKSMARLFDSTRRMRPSCGTRFLGNVEAGNDLDPRGDLVLDDQRRRCDFAQNAVNPEADAVALLVGFEMDVGGAIVDGVKQHLLDEFDDRRVVDVLRGDFLSAALRVFVSKLQVDVLTTQIFQ